MWGNLGNVVGAALSKVQKLSSELESQMDAAVGVEEKSPKANLLQKSQLSPVHSSEVQSIPVEPIVETTKELMPEIVTPLPKSAVAAETSTIVDSPNRITPKKLTKSKSIVKSKSQVISSAPTMEQAVGQELKIDEGAAPRGNDVNLDVVEEYKRRLKEMQQKVKLQASKQDDLERCISSLQEQLQGKDDVIQDINKKHSLLQEQFDQAKEALIQKENEAAVFSKNLSTQQSIVAATSDKLARLESELTSKLDEISSYKRALDTAQSEISKFREERDELQNQLITRSASPSSLSISNPVEISEALNKVVTVEKPLQIDSGSQCNLSDDADEERAKAAKEVEDALREELRSVVCNFDSFKLDHTKTLEELEASKLTISTLKEEISAYEASLSSSQEIIHERERALETAASKMSETHKLLEDSQRRVSDLNAEITEKDSKLRQGQSAASVEAELRKQLTKALDSIKERDERLTAFEQEGQKLSKKQGEMEKLVRTAKKEIKDKETEIVKLKESKEQLVKAIEETQEQLRKNEAEATNSSKSMSAMQAVSAASSDKLAKLEAELATKFDEIASQKRALETAWAESNETKRVLAELRAERDDLKRQLGEGTSKVLETELGRKDVEQREAVLRATSKQLQDSLQRQMSEAVSREERLREEANEMRKRWQEAITTRENLATELSGATAPLLRQISALQESHRMKSESWQNIESSLSERALRAESAVEMAEHKKVFLEEQLTVLKQQLAQQSSRYQDAWESLQAAESLVEKLKKSESMATDKVNELESRLALEIGQKQSLQSSLREWEARHRNDTQDVREANELALKQSELKLKQCQAEIDSLRYDLMEERKRTSGNGSGNSNSLKNNRRHAKSVGKEHSLTSNDFDGNEDDYVKSTKSFPGLSSLPNGETSFAASERYQQQLQRKEEDSQAAAHQLQQLQASRDALLDEVAFLSSRNAQLEEATARFPIVNEELVTTKKRVELLLVLLGEKEEELEAMLNDMKEVKQLYRSQLDELLVKVAPDSIRSAES